MDHIKSFSNLFFVFVRAFPSRFSSFQFHECYKSVRNLFFPKKRKERKTLHFNKIHVFESIIYLGKGTALHSSWSLGPIFCQASNPRRASMGFVTIYKGLKSITIVCISMASSTISISSKCHMYHSRIQIS